ncbi:MAG: Twin-arginine translocation pathway signal sequence domain-containing protein, partial [Burkholderiales bacterium]|nr:Twin-arginine translocation pathway signal sequence domain-containing protein [Burkholderiales bacterium]
MLRRDFLKLGGLTALVSLTPTVAFAAAAQASPRLLVLIELKGGNDGLNTVVPYTDEHYYTLRPKLAIARDQVLQLDERTGLHPALAPLMPLWQSHKLAVVQGVGYPKPNLSHFRSIEIWDTASDSDETLQSGWLTRQFAASPLPHEYVADGIAVGSPELGPLDGGARALVLQNTEAFVKQARLANDMAGGAPNAAL